MLARFTGSFSGFMLPCIYTLTVSTILSNLISSKAFDKAFTLTEPSITNGRKYQVLFLKSWKTWSRAVAKNRRTNIAANASDEV